MLRTGEGRDGACVWGGVARVSSTATGTALTSAESVGTVALFSSFSSTARDQY